MSAGILQAPHSTTSRPLVFPSIFAHGQWEALSVARRELFMTGGHSNPLSFSPFSEVCKTPLEAAFYPYPVFLVGHLGHLPKSRLKALPLLGLICPRSLGHWPFWLGHSGTLRSTFMDSLPPCCRQLRTRGPTRCRPGVSIVPSRQRRQRRTVLGGDRRQVALGRSRGKALATNGSSGESAAISSRAGGWLYCGAIQQD